MFKHLRRRANLARSLFVVNELPVLVSCLPLPRIVSLGEVKQAHMLRVKWGPASKSSISRRVDPAKAAAAPTERARKPSRGIERR